MELKTLATEEERRAQSEGLSWLFEIEALNNPMIHNALVLNIFRVSPKIVDTQLVMDRHKKKMLIFLELTKWGQFFQKKKVATQVANMIHEVLPSYEIRVVFSREILEKSLEVAKKLELPEVTGQKNNDKQEVQTENCQ